MRRKADCSAEVACWPARVLLYFQQVDVAAQFAFRPEVHQGGFNQLTSLPSLPSKLEELRCKENRLTSLPSLPARLTSLGCEGNQLTSLPLLPASLKWLRCGNNRLTSLPKLPVRLEGLECEDNQLTTIDLADLSLYWIDCQRNNMVSVSDVIGFADKDKWDVEYLGEDDADYDAHTPFSFTPQNSLP